MPHSTTGRVHHLTPRPSAHGSVRDIMDFVIRRNKEQSEQFSHPGARLIRRQYRANHPTEIAALKCMDGRLNLSVMTQTPLGILQPYRNIGGKFDLGWPYLGHLLKEWVTFSVDVKGRNCILLATYHFSKGDINRGCAGFKYDTAAAKAAAANLVVQIGRVFGTPYSVVHPVLVGMETDEDSLIFHSERGEEFIVADNLKMTFEELDEVFAEMYPQMLDSVRNDLLELVIGNQRHIRELRQEKRPVADFDHREQILAVGRGFDWLHEPNKALIVGPYSENWPSAVATAATIVQKNFENNRLDPDAGVLLFSSALSRDGYGSFGWNMAVEKARFMLDQSLAAIKTVPGFLESHDVALLAGVVDSESRLLHILQ